MLNADIIRPPTRPRSSSIWFVGKIRCMKIKLRMIIDYRSITQTTLSHHYPSPNITASLNKFDRLNYFNVLDLTNEILQTEINHE